MGWVNPVNWLASVYERMGHWGLIPVGLFAALMVGGLWWLAVIQVEKERNPVDPTVVAGAAGQPQATTPEGAAVRQSTSGPNSPNVSGNQNTVIISDSGVSQPVTEGERLDALIGASAIQIFAETPGRPDDIGVAFTIQSATDMIAATHICLFNVVHVVASDDLAMRVHDTSAVVRRLADISPGRSRILCDIRHLINVQPDDHQWFIAEGDVSLGMIFSLQGEIDRFRIVARYTAIRDTLGLRWNLVGRENERLRP
jgi:hypothetical protein